MKNKIKIAVILSGCGVYDGTEIHEAIMTMLAIDRAGAQYYLFAPSIDQFHVINHCTGEVSNEKRNVLVESARIGRGDVSDLNEYKASDYDALIIPGGFGVAKNLSDFAFGNDSYKVIPEVEIAVTEAHSAGKPIGALCIASVILAHTIKNVELTIGSDAGTAARVVNKGAKHVNSSLGEVVIDNKNKIVTAACYMLNASIAQIASDSELVVNAIIEMIENL